MGNPNGPRRQLVVAVPGKRGLGLIAVVIAILLAIVLIPLMATTMDKGPAHCGTIFASKDSWTYDSSFDPNDDSYDSGALNQRDLDRGLNSAIDDMMSDLNLGSAAYDTCQDLHRDRLVVVLTLAGGVVLFVIAGLILWLRGRRESAAGGGADPTAGD